MSNEPGFNIRKFLSKGFKRVTPAGMTPKEALITLALAGPAAVFGSAFAEGLGSQLQEVTAQGMEVTAGLAVAVLPVWIGAAALMRKMEPEPTEADVEPDETPSFRM